MQLYFVSVFFAFILFAINGADAVEKTASSHLSVKLEIKKGCSINFDQNNEINFGFITAISRNISRTNSFSVRCSEQDVSDPSAQILYDVRFDAGQNAIPGNIMQRRLKGINTGAYLDYKIDPATVRGTRFALAPHEIVKLNESSHPLTPYPLALDKNWLGRYEFIVTITGPQEAPVDKYFDTIQAILFYQ